MREVYVQIDDELLYAIKIFHRVVRDNYSLV